MARLDDKHLVVCEHLGESVGKDLAHLDINLMHLQLLLVTLNPHILIAAGILSHLQLMCVGVKNTHTQEKYQNNEKIEVRQTALIMRLDKEKEQISIYIFMLSYLTVFTGC